MSMIFFFSTSFGEWSHSQAMIQALLHRFSLDPLASESLSHLNFALRKLAHFSEYALLLSVIYWGGKAFVQKEPRHLMPWVLAFVVLFAISDEFGQIASLLQSASRTCAHAAQLYALQFARKAG